MEESGDVGIRGIFLPLGFPPLSTAVVPGILVLDFKVNPAERDD